MSSVSSYNGSTSDTDDSEINYIKDYELEVETDRQSGDSLSASDTDGTSSDEDACLCADDPVADEEWTANYKKELKVIEEEEKVLKDRLERRTQLHEW